MTRQSFCALSANGWHQLLRLDSFHWLRLIKAELQWCNVPPIPAICPRLTNLLKQLLYKESERILHLEKVLNVDRKSVV